MKAGRCSEAEALSQSIYWESIEQPIRNIVLTGHWPIGGTIVLRCRSRRKLLLRFTFQMTTSHGAQPVQLTVLLGIYQTTPPSPRYSTHTEPLLLLILSIRSAATLSCSNPAFPFIPWANRHGSACITRSASNTVHGKSELILCLFDFEAGGVPTNPDLTKHQFRGAANQRRDAVFQICHLM